MAQPKRKLLRQTLKARLAARGLRVEKLDAIRIHENYCADIQRLMYAKPMRVVFDVGANVGQSTKRFLDWFPDARIFAFEPVTPTTLT